jgi:hypothetical protein
VNIMDRSSPVVTFAFSASAACGSEGIDYSIFY